jgi:hypothetical protein
LTSVVSAERKTRFLSVLDKCLNDINNLCLTSVDDAWVVEYITPARDADLVRMTRLGVMTCQRVSDMVRMGPRTS